MRFVLGLIVGLMVGSGVVPVKHAIHVIAHEISESVR
jgi:LPS O-antigen subunit length determinant protein (WzzB/FepE family)